MDIVTRMLINKVKKIGRKDPTRQRACVLVYQDLPTILQHEYDHFIKKERNVGKDVIDFHFIKQFQQKQALKTGKGMQKQKTFKKEQKPVKQELKQELEQPKAKSTMTIGELIKANS